MSSRTRRVSVLALSSTINFLIHFLSPIILVRVLDIESFGKYREFYLYIGLISSFIEFGIRSNLLYFIPKYPDSEKSLVANTIVLKFGVAIVGLLLISIFKSEIISAASFDFFIPLLVFIFVAQNIDFIDIYWLAQKKSNYVLYYSALSITIRLIVIVIVAYISRSVLFIIYSAIAVETIRALFSIIYLYRKKLLSFNIDTRLLKEQLKYVVPLGIAGIIVIYNRDISKLIISANLGVSALALYSIASHRLPFVDVVRGSISNVIFPDMAEQIANDKVGALKLWSKSTNLFLFMIAPLAILMFYYADVIIVTLFTEEYIAAVPIFKIYTIFFFQQAFEMGVPIRAMNKNNFLLIGHFISLIINTTLLFLLFKIFGFIGPAIAAVLTEIIITIFFGAMILRIYKIKIYEMYEWQKIFKILIAALLLLPILYLGELLNFNQLTEAILFSSIYLMTYLLFLKHQRITEIDQLMNKILKRFRLSWVK